jgi:hypothetical protein
LPHFGTVEPAQLGRKKFKFMKHETKNGQQREYERKGMNLLPDECKSRQILVDQVTQLGHQRAAVRTTRDSLAQFRTVEPAKLERKKIEFMKHETKNWTTERMGTKKKGTYLHMNARIGLTRAGLNCDRSSSVVQASHPVNEEGVIPREKEQEGSRLSSQGKELL